MRLYSFVNYYLSGIQKGIQTAHMVAEMGFHYPFNSAFGEWARNHKTIIVLDGGNNFALNNLWNKLVGFDSSWPIAKFVEDKESLNGATTAVGILLPQAIWNGEISRFTKRNSFEIYELVSSAKLAV